MIRIRWRFSTKKDNVMTGTLGFVFAPIIQCIRVFSGEINGDKKDAFNFLFTHKLERYFKFYCIDKMYDLETLCKKVRMKSLERKEKQDGKKNTKDV